MRRVVSIGAVCVLSIMNVLGFCSSHFNPGMPYDRPQAVNLQETYSLSLSDNPLLMMSEADTLTAVYNEGLASSAFLPKVTLDLSYLTAYMYQGTGSSWKHIPPTALTQSQMGLGATATIAYTINLSSLFGFNQVRHLVEAAKVNAEQVESDFIQQFVLLYLNVIAARSEWAAVVSQKDLLLHAYEKEKEKFDMGDGNVVNKNRAWAQLEAAQASIIAMQLNESLQAEKLNEFVGQQVKVEGHIPFHAEFPHIADDVTQGLIDKVREQSFKLRQLKHAHDAAKSGVYSARSAYIPTATVGAKLSQNYGDKDHLKKPDATYANIQFNLNWNVFTGGARHYTEKLAVNSMVKSRYQLIHANRQIVSDFRMALIQYNGLKAQLKAQRAAIEAAVSAYQVIHDLYLSADVSIVEFSDSGALLMKAKKEYASTFVKLVMSYLTLQSYLKGCDPDDLDFIGYLLSKERTESRDSLYDIH